MDTPNLGLSVIMGDRDVNEYRFGDPSDLNTYQTYIEAVPDQPYAISLINRLPERVLAVVSVDGICTLDREPASWHSPGYVVPPNSIVVVNGWQEDERTASQFVFRPTAQALAMLHPRGTGVGKLFGTIRAVYFREDVRPIPIFGGDEEASFPEGVKAPKDATVGTGGGNWVPQPITHTEYTRRAYYTEILTIRYHDVKHLERLGVHVGSTLHPTIVDRPATDMPLGVSLRSQTR